MIAPSNRTARSTERALPKAQSRACRNWFWIRFPPHPGARPAGETRYHDPPRRRDKNEDAARDNARQAQRERDPPEGVPLAGPEILGSLLQAGVELLERRVEWQGKE